MRPVEQHPIFARIDPTHGEFVPAHERIRDKLERAGDERWAPGNGLSMPGVRRQAALGWADANDDWTKSGIRRNLVQRIRDVAARQDAGWRVPGHNDPPPPSSQIISNTPWYVCQAIGAGRRTVW